MLTRFPEFDSLLPAFGTMRRELERSFGEVANNGQAAVRNFCPISLWQDDRQVHIQVDVPGMTNDQLDLRFEDGKLWIRGNRIWSDKKVSFEYNERRFGQFERVVALTDTVDPSTIDAELRDGVLHISFTKRPEAQPRSVPIRYQNESMKRLEDSACELTPQDPVHQ